MSQIWDFILLETKNVTKLKNKYDIQSSELQ